MMRLARLFRLLRVMKLARELHRRAMAEDLSVVMATISPIKDCVLMHAESQVDLTLRLLQLQVPNHKP